MSQEIDSDVVGLIRAEFSFTAEHGVLGESKMGTSSAAWTGLDRMHMHVLVCRGFPNVVGVCQWSGDPGKHDALICSQMARTDALNRLSSMVSDAALMDDAARAPGLSD